MTPLVHQFTKNLSGCSGCGNSDAVYATWLKAKQFGEKMKFQLSVVIEADTYKQAVNKVPDDWEILSGGVKPDLKTPPSMSQPPGLPSVKTNMRTGLPVNG